MVQPCAALILMLFSNAAYAQDDPERILQGAIALHQAGKAGQIGEAKYPDALPVHSLILDAGRAALKG